MKSLHIALPDILAWGAFAVCAFVLAVRICYTVHEDRRRHEAERKDREEEELEK